MDNLKGMTYDQIVAALKEYADRQQPHVPDRPVPAELTPANRTPEQLAQLSDNWLSWIMSRDHNTWTAEEKEAVRIACVRAAKDARY